MKKAIIAIVFAFGQIALAACSQIDGPAPRYAAYQCLDRDTIFCGLWKPGGE